MRKFVKDLWLLLSGSKQVPAQDRLRWTDLTLKQQRDEIRKVYAMAVCHKGNMPWPDAEDRCHMAGDCDTCQRIADAFVDVETVMRSELMR
jgi:hypothetical protein